MDVYSYRLDGNLYINLTNKCSNSCTFCVRNGKNEYFGNSLWLSREPTFDEVVLSVDNLETYSEVVFCGFGEPTYKLAELVALGKYFKSIGKKVRLNTNGHGNFINKMDIVPQLKQSVDVVSVSLNASSSEGYDKVCCPHFDNAFDEMMSFAKMCANCGIETILSVVDIIGSEEIDKSRKLAESIGATLKVRALIENS